MFDKMQEIIPILERLTPWQMEMIKELVELNTKRSSEEQDKNNIDSL